MITDTISAPESITADYGNDDPGLAHWESERRPGWTLCGQPPEAPSNGDGPDCVVCRSLAEEGLRLGRYWTAEKL